MNIICKPMFTTAVNHTIVNHTAVNHVIRYLRSKVITRAVTLVPHNLSLHNLKNR